MRCTLLKRTAVLQPSSTMLQKSLMALHFQSSCISALAANAAASLSCAQPLIAESHSAFRKSLPLNRLQLDKLVRRPHRFGAVAISVSQPSDIERAALAQSNVGRERGQSIRKWYLNASPPRSKRSYGCSSQLPATSTHERASETLETRGLMFDQPHFLRITRGGEKLSCPAEDGGAQVVPAGSWEAATPGAWEDHLLYYRSFYDLFVQHATRASDSLWGCGEGPFSDLEVRQKGLLLLS